MFGFDRECLSESLLGLLLYVYTLHYRVTTLKGREGEKAPFENILHLLQRLGVFFAVWATFKSHLTRYLSM